MNAMIELVCVVTDKPFYVTPKELGISWPLLVRITHC